MTIEADGRGPDARMNGGAATADICILIPTTERYRWVAAFTARVLGRYWQEHPPVFFCGCENGADPAWLPLENDPRDWMGIVGSAADHLRGLGYSCCYLVLDDHPPLAACHAQHLNVTLPQFMARLDAAYIGLNGWGQGREGRRLSGERLGRVYYDLERLPVDFRWKFSLHPALWRLDSLVEILEYCARGKTVEQRNAWAFERGASAPDATLAPHLKSGAYRVCGAAMTVRRIGRLWTAAEYSLASLVSRVVGRLAPAGMADAFRELAATIGQFYEGPYPLFWSGIMQRGQLNQQFLHYLKLHGRRDYLGELMRSYEAAHGVQRS